MSISKEDCKLQSSDIGDLIASICSALSEQSGLIETSYSRFDSVLKQVAKADGVGGSEKANYQSCMANNLMDIRDKIVDSNNRILEFNKRCDL